MSDLDVSQSDFDRRIAHLTQRDRLASRHWAFFETDVLGLIDDWTLEALPFEIRRTVLSNLAIPRRFKTSESCFALLGDLNALSEPGVAPLMGALELAQHGRLVLDDVLDEHTSRWNVPSLWKQYGVATAVVIANTLWSGAAALLESSREARSKLADGVDVIATLGYVRSMIDRSSLLELEFDKRRATFQEFEAIALNKNCLGWAVPTLVQQLFPDALSPEDGVRLAQAFERIDVAAAITNDLTETHGRRGRDVVRLPAGEDRGKNTELQLGRPTIFTVFFGTDEYLVWRKSIGAEDFAEHLAQLDRDEIESLLRDSGGLDWAEKIASREREAARELLAECTRELPLTSDYLLRGLRANMPKDPE
jgi:geranylgeranyl pyrophosphate synthase